MTRYSFGGDMTHLITTADTNLGGALKVAPGKTIDFYLARTGGSPVTDYLIDPDGTGSYSTAASAVVSRATGYLPNFQGPDTVSILYYDPDADDADAQRVRLEAWDLDIATLPTASDTVVGTIRKATQGEVDAGVSDVGAVTPLKVATSPLIAKAKNTEVDLTGTSDTAVTYTVVDDFSSQGSWVERWKFMFGSVLTGRFDKYGQIIAGAAKATTVPLRVENLQSSPTADLIQAGTTADLDAFRVKPDGTVVAPNISGSTPVVLGTTDPVPAGTPDLTLIARLVSGGTIDPGGGGGGALLLKDHPHEGTAGQSPTPAAEGYTSSGGAASTYVTGGTVGSTALQWANAVTGNLTDTYTAQASDLYVRFYCKLVSVGSGATTMLWIPGISVEIRYTASELTVRDAAGVGVSTTITRPTDNTWWRGLWRIGLTTQTLEIWTTPASTGAATYTATNTYAAAVARPTSLSVGQKVATGGVVQLDAIALGTAPIGPAA